MVPPFVLNGNNLSIFLMGKPYSINNAHPNFKKIVAGLKSGLDEDDLAGLIQANLKKEIAKAVGVEFKEDGMILMDGEPVSDALVVRYRFMIENDFPLEGFKLFVQNLAQNPSRDSRKDLYGFLEACTLPITEDGHFLAYKKVDKNYKDCHTGKVDNSIGATPEMPRDKVNPNRKETCSSGYHVCSRSYLSSFGGVHIMVCKVNPKDVVTVPLDYNNAKMRICRYEVISELKNENRDAIQDMAVKAEEPVTISEADEKTAKELKSKVKAKIEAKKELTKSEKWDDYIKTRNIPEDLNELHGNPRRAFIKFCARLRNTDGSEKAGEDICGAKTASEIRKIILGY
jgi:hypothetical protein